MQIRIFNIPITDNGGWYVTSGDSMNGIVLSKRSMVHLLWRNTMKTFPSPTFGKEEIQKLNYGFHLRGLSAETSIIVSI